MKIPNHTRNSLLVRQRLDGLGLPPEILVRIGAFAVSWGLSETHLERAIWVLRKEDVKGTYKEFRSKGIEH